jgi:RimJ/RimL family protein N-acetyltransferase
MLYIGSDSELPLASTPDLKVEAVDPARSDVVQWFSHSSVRFVGAHTGCSCGFPSVIAESPIAYYEGMPLDSDDRAADLRSVRALIGLVAHAIAESDRVELYPVADGDESQAPRGVIDWELGSLDPDRLFFNERFMHVVRREGRSDEATSLVLVPKTRDEIEAMIAAMTPDERAQLSADWLARVRASELDPWVHWYSARLRDSGIVVGAGGFKGPPIDGAVEIAYGVEADHRGKGYATQIAGALVRYAFRSEEVQVVRAHTLPEGEASKRVLAKCGFEHVGEVIDPDDGLVWRFEKRRQSAR